MEPLEQMKEFIKTFYGNPQNDATKSFDSIVNFFNIIRLPGVKEDLCFQYAPKFLKVSAYRWWMENKALLLKMTRCSSSCILVEFS